MFGGKQIQKIAGVLRGKKSKAVGPQYNDPDSVINSLRRTIDEMVRAAGTKDPSNAEFSPPPPGTSEVYRRIDNYPTAFLATTKLFSPILINPWKWPTKQDDVPDAWVKDIRAAFDPMRETLLHQYRESLTDGWGPIQIQIKPNGKGYDITDATLLNRDRSELLANEDTAKIIGVRNVDANNDQIDLPIDSIQLFINRPYAGSPYGVSIHEPARDSGAWSNSIQIIERFGRYVCKIAGVIWAMHYPIGTGRNAQGVEFPNEWLAKRMMDQLTQGKNIRIPNKFAAMVAPGDNMEQTGAMLERALKVAGLSDWTIECYHPEGANFCEGFVRGLEYNDELIVRSYGIPDKAVLPSKKGGLNSGGNKQEDNTADMVSQLYYAQFCAQLGAQEIDRFAVARFGERARGKLWPRPPALSQENSDAIMQILKALATNQSVGQELAATMDVEGAFDELHIPVLAENRGTWNDRIQKVITNQQSNDKAQANKPKMLPKPSGNGRMK